MSTYLDTLKSIQERKIEERTSLRLKEMGLEEELIEVPQRRPTIGYAFSEEEKPAIGSR